uniref:Uncharacterized protein n=1 Tax=Anguilla anguilla TaxID=7936 RepID=A0A0E9SMA7_ANGAN
MYSPAETSLPPLLHPASARHSHRSRQETRPTLPIIYLSYQSFN